MTPRHLALGGALAATLAASAWVATRPEQEMPGVAAALPARRPSPAASAPDTGPTPRQPWAEAPAAQLAAWQPPAPPPAASAPPVPVAAPPPPSAPLLPWQMIGRLIDGEGAAAEEVALLAGPGRALNVKRGDVIDGQWRVEQVTTAGVRLTWLPASLPQNIPFKPLP